MKDKQPQAFAGSTVISTRKDSAIEDAVVRRRAFPDGRRITTYEVEESKIEQLLSIPNGLVRRNTAINPVNIERAKELATSGVARKDAEEQMGVSSGTYRRLLQAGGVDVRKYTQVLTQDNILQALKVTTKYDISKRGELIKAAKEMNTDSRTLRRLLARGLATLTQEQIAAIRSEEAARLQTPEGQKELEMSKQPVKRAAKKAKKEAEERVPDGPKDGDTTHMPVDQNTPAPVRDAIERGDDHTAETGMVNSPLVPVMPHEVEVREKDGQKVVIEQPTLIQQPGTSLHEPHGDGDHRTARDAAAADVAAEKPIDAALKPLEMVPPVTPVDALDRTRPSIVSGGTTVEPIGAVSDVEEQRAKGIFQPMRDGVPVPVDPAIPTGNVEQWNADQDAAVTRSDAKDDGSGGQKA